MHAFSHPDGPAGIFPYMYACVNMCAYANARFFPDFFPRFSTVQDQNPSRFFPGIFPGIPVENPVEISRRFPTVRRRRIRVSETFSERSYEEISDVYDGTLRFCHPEKSRRDISIGSDGGFRRMSAREHACKPVRHASGCHPKSPDGISR